MIFLCYIIYVMLIDIFKLVYYFYLEFLKFNKIIELNNVNYFNDNNYNIKQPSLFSIGIISYYGIRGIFNIFKNNIFVTASFFSIIKFSLIYYSYVFGGYANKVIKNFIKKIYEDNKGSDNNSENSNGGNTKRDAKVEADINKSSDSNQEINNKFNDDLALNNYNLDTINNEVDLNNNGEIFNNLLYSVNDGGSSIEILINNIYLLEFCKIIFLYLIFNILINRIILKLLDNSGIIYKININWFKNYMIKHFEKILIINKNFFNLIIKFNIISVIAITLIDLFGIFAIWLDIRKVVIDYLVKDMSGKVSLTITNINQLSILENYIWQLFYINLLIIFLIFISLILYRNVKNIKEFTKRWIILYFLIFLIIVLFIIFFIYIKDLSLNLDKYLLDYIDLHIIVNSLFIFNNKDISLKSRYYHKSNVNYTFNNNYNTDSINNEVYLNNNDEIFNNLLYSLNTEGLGHSNIEGIINNMYILELCKILFLYLIYSILINRFILKWIDNSGIINKININWLKNHMIKHINKMLIINIKFFNFIIKLSIITIIGISIMELFGIFGINFDIRIIIINYLKTINSGKIHLTIINMDQYSVLENSIHTIFYINLLIIFLILISLILYRNVKNIDTNLKRWIILYILIFLINIIFIFNHIYIKDLMDNLNKYILDYMDLHIIVNSLFIFNNKYKIKELNKRIKKFIYIKIKLIYCTYKFIYSKINDLFYNFKNKSKYCFILPFIIKTLEKEIPAEADHIISFSFNILILLIIVLLSFINIIGYFLSIYLINKYDIETKFPKFSWIIRKYEQSNLIFVSIEIFIALTFLIIAIIGHLWFIGIFVF
nr:orf832 [Flammulina velutipes]AEO19664.1 orf832 [Flammulina velutipes]